MTPLASRLAIASLLCVTAFTSAPARADGPLTINAVERATSDTVIDIGEKDDSAGDVLTFANELYDEGNANKIGSDNGWCIRIVKGVSWECVATIMLDGGQLTVEGPFLDGKDSVWAITGGTGKYNAAKGDMQLHARNAEGSEYDFKFAVVQ